MKVIRRIAWVTVGFTYFLVALGVTVRANNAGLSCPDWPLCFGQPFAFPDVGALLEESHRYTASIVSILIVVQVICVWLWARKDRRLLVPTLLMPVLLIPQIILGALTVLLKLDGPIIVSHLATALVLFADVITVAIMAGTSHPNKESPARTRKFVRLAITCTLLVYGLMLSGSYVVNTGSSLACPGWPLCGPAPSWAVQFHLSDINMLHRIVATIVGLVLVWTLISAWRRRRVAPAQAWLAVAAGILFIIQSGFGALIVLLLKPVPVQILHLATSTAIWGCLVAMTGLAVRQLHATSEEALQQEAEEEAQTDGAEAGSIRQTISSYINLMKPHVTVLLLGTTLAAMAIAWRGLPPAGLIVATLLGGAMAAGSANCINCYIDRDIDLIMGRTARRSLPSGKVQPKQALLFGIALGIGSFLILTAFVNLLSAALALAANLFYVFIYTIWLKRTSFQNIVIGGAAGAVPVLVGWAAVTNTITLPAIWLFAIIFYWTPPHFWALSLLIQKDYEKAHIPMMPVVLGERETHRQIVLYSLLLLAVTLVLFAIHAMGYLYLIGALALGGVLVYMAIRLWHDQSKQWARTLFWYSNCYLAAIFAVMVIDRVIHY